MEININFNKKMLVEMANRVLDEYEYNGKTIREWADLIANPETNADRLRSMSDEEFSHFLFGIQCAPASRPKEWLDWLRQEAKE